MNRRASVAAGGMALGIAVFAIGAFAEVAHAGSSEISEAAQRLSQAVAERLVAFPADLMARFEEDRERWMATLPPDPDIHHLYVGGTLAIRIAGFPAEVIQGLTGVVKHGVTRYPIRVLEDRQTRERVIENGAGEAIVRLPAPLGYDPGVYAKSRFAEAMARDRRIAERLLAIYDPARIVMEYELIAEEDLAAWAEAEAAEGERLAAKLEEQAPRALEGGAPPDELSFVEIRVEPDGGIRLSLAWLPGSLSSNTLDLFACPDLVRGPWRLARTFAVDPAAGAHSVVVEGDAPQQFFDGWTHDDSDGDRIPDGRERRLYGTDPNNADTDGDGLTDFEEIVFHQTDPGNPDSDGDGITDGGEVDQGADPNDPGNRPDDEWFVLTGGEPQDVTKTRIRTVTIPAGETRVLIVAVHSQEYPVYTGDASVYNDLLEWQIEPEGGGAVVGAIDVNSRHQQWLEAEGKTPLVGHHPVHIEHAVLLTAPANAPLMIRMTLKATNIGDGLLPSTVIAGIPKVRVDLDGDTDRNGVIDGGDEDGEDASTRVRGILITPPLRELQEQDNNIEGLARIRLSAFIQAPVEGLTYRLRKMEQPTGVMLHIIKTDGTKLPDRQQGQAYVLDPWDGIPIEFAVMPQYARPLNLNTGPVRFVLELDARDAANNLLHSDRILLTVAPLIIAPECNAAQQIHTTNVEGIPGTVSADVEDAVQWAQDMVKFAYYQIRSDQPPQSCVINLLHTGRGGFPEKLRNEHNHVVILPWERKTGLRTENEQDIEFGLYALRNPNNTVGVVCYGDGGNIMATAPFPPEAPLGFLIIGISGGMTRVKDHGLRPVMQGPFFEGQGAQPVIEIDTSWLQVGHVDEILMWVAPQKVLYADPWRAADLLHQEIAAGRGGATLWCGFTPEGKNRTIRDVAVASRPGGFKISTLSEPGLPDNSEPAILTFPEAIFAVGDFLRVNNEILKVTAVDGATITVARAQAGRPAAAHAPGSVIYALSALLVDNLPTWGAPDSRVVGKISKVLRQLRDGLGAHADEVTFVPMPVLFDKIPETGKYAAATANVVNGVLLVDGTFLYPSTGCIAFRDYIASKLPPAQGFVNHWDALHCADGGGGGLHCATSAKRGWGFEESWWQSLTHWE